MELLPKDLSSLSLPSPPPSPSPPPYHPLWTFFAPHFSPSPLVRVYQHRLRPRKRPQAPTPAKPSVPALAHASVREIAFVMHRAGIYMYGTRIQPPAQVDRAQMVLGEDGTGQAVACFVELLHDVVLGVDDVEAQQWAEGFDGVERHVGFDVFDQREWIEIAGRAAAFGLGDFGAFCLRVVDKAGEVRTAFGGDDMRFAFGPGRELVVEGRGEGLGEWALDEDRVNTHADLTVLEGEEWSVSMYQ